MGGREGGGWGGKWGVEGKLVVGTGGGAYSPLRGHTGGVMCKKQEPEDKVGEDQTNPIRSRPMRKCFYSI